MDPDNTISRLGFRIPREAWNNFRRDFSASVLFSFFNVVFNQFYVPNAIQHGATMVQVGLLTAAPAIGLLLSPVWAGLMTNRDPKPFVVVPNLVGRSLVVLPALYPDPWVYVGVALLFQLLMGIQAPAYAALVTRMYPANLRGRLMGYVRVAMGGLMIPLAYAIGKWLDRSGDAGPLVAAAVTGVVSILVFSLVRNVEGDGEAGKGNRAATYNLSAPFKLVRSQPELLVFLAATTLAGFGNLLANPLYQIIQVDHLHLSNVQIGYARMMYFFCLLLSYWVMGWIIDRYSPSHALFFGIAVYVLVPLLYGLFGNYPAVVAGSGLQGFGDAIWDIGCMAYVFRAAPGNVAVVFSLHLMLFGIRGTIGPLLSTGLARLVPIPSLLFAAALCALAGLIVFALGHQRKNARPAQRTFMPHG